MVAWVRVLAVLAMSVAIIRGAAAQSITVVASVAAIQGSDNSLYQYVFVQNPDLTVASPPAYGGGLFVRLQTSSSNATQCISNNVTVVLDTKGNCFVRTSNLNLRDFGAKGDTRSGFTDGTFNTTTLFCSKTAGFSPADVNKHIYIQGAGATFTPASSTGNPNVGPHYATLDTMVASFSGTNPNCVTIKDAGQSQGVWGSVLGPSVAVKPAPMPGTGYSPGDILPLATGGTSGTPLPAAVYCGSNKPNGSNATCAATLQVNVVTVVGASVSAAGTGTTRATTCTLTGTTGSALSGQLVQVTVTPQNNQIPTGPVTSISISGLYTALPTDITKASVTGCPGITGAQLNLTFGVYQASLVWNGMYSKLPSTTPLGVSTTNYHCTSTCSGVMFDITGTTQMNIFSVGTDDTPALVAAMKAQNTIADITSNTQNINSRVCIYAPAGVYSVQPVNTPTQTQYLLGNGCVLGDGQQQTIFHVRPNVGGDLFAWHNAGQNGALPFNGSTMLLNINQAGPVCRGFGVEGDRNSMLNQNAIVFYGINEFISCTDIQADYLLGSGLRCGDGASRVEVTRCTESHFRDLRFTRDGDGQLYPVISMLAAGNTDGNNNIDLTDVDIYNPRGTGMYFSDTSTSNANHNIAMARIRWEGSENSVAGITTDLLQIDGGAQGTARITCLECRWENPYFGSAAIHFTGTTKPPSDIVLDGRIVGSSGLGRGVQVDAGSNLNLNFPYLSSLDYNVYLASDLSAGSVFLNGYGAESGWTFYAPSPGALIGPLQRLAAGASSAFVPALPNLANGCNGRRGQGAADLQTDCTLPTQGASGMDSFVAAGSGNSASGTAGFAGGMGANDTGRLAVTCWSSGVGTTIAQSCSQTFRGTTTGGNGVPLTADGKAPGSTNVLNILPGSSFAVRVIVSAVDVSTPGTFYTASWSAPHLLTRTGAAVSTRLDNAMGSITADALAPAAQGSAMMAPDMTNGGLAVSFTPPTSSDTWRVGAKIETVEVN